MQPEHSKVEAVKQFQVPTTKTSVRTFLGLTGYNRKFIPGYAELAASLTDLTRKNALNKVKWSEECDGTFSRLKESLCGEPVLRCPQFLPAYYRLMPLGGRLALC